MIYLYVLKIKYNNIFQLNVDCYFYLFQVHIVIRYIKLIIIIDNMKNAKEIPILVYGLIQCRFVDDNVDDKVDIKRYGTTCIHIALITYSVFILLT